MPQMKMPYEGQHRRVKPADDVCVQICLQMAFGTFPCCCCPVGTRANEAAAGLCWPADGADQHKYASVRKLAIGHGLATAHTLLASGLLVMVYLGMLGYGYTWLY